MTWEEFFAWLEEFKKLPKDSYAYIVIDAWGEKDGKVVCI